MFLITTKNFPPELGGMQMLMGGLSNRAEAVGEIFDVAKFDIIIYETVGVGQVELDVVECVDSVVVTLVPDSGDDIQIMKAGLIDIADLYVINKYDRKDSDKMYLFLRNMLSMIDKDKWIPPIVKTIAIKDFGISDLVKKISKHKKYLLDNNYMIEKINKRYIKNIQDRLFQNYEKKFWNKRRVSILNDELKKDLEERKMPNEIIKTLYSK